MVPLLIMALTKFCFANFESVAILGLLVSQIHVGSNCNNYHHNFHYHYYFHYHCYFLLESCYKNFTM